MSPNEELITKFYTAFSQKNIAEMAACYHEDATFRDPIFYLKGSQIMDMWKMLIERGTDMEITFGKVHTRKNKVEVTWNASYSFSSTGQQVHNTIKASFTFRDGKIHSHHDNFNFHQWAGQALGWSGKLLGWSSFLRNKVRKQAMERLLAYTSQ